MFNYRKSNTKYIKFIVVFGINRFESKITVFTKIENYALEQIGILEGSISSL